MTKRRANRGRRVPVGEGRPVRAGMTLMELVVSLAILTIMILMANTLLIRTRRTVWLAQGTIRANADIRAAADRLRSDLAGATKEGFLAVGARRISYREDPNDPSTQVIKDVPFLVFTNVSTFRSVVDDAWANFARIDYGLSGGPDHVFWRRAILHDPNVVAGADHVETFLAAYRMPLPQTRSVRMRIHQVLTTAFPPDNLRIIDASLPPLPPQSLSQAVALWPLLISGVQELKIQWTDGTRINGRLVWYDAENSKVDRLIWLNRGPAYQEANPAQDAPEYNANRPGEEPGAYCALWTFRKKDNWPKAIRLAMTLGDPPRLHEVVVSLPQ